MQITVAFGYVNWGAVLAATVVTFVLSGFWYSPVLFGQSPSRRDDVAAAGTGRHIELIFVVAFLLQWFAASLLGAVLGPNSDLRYGLTVGLMIGVFFITTAFGMTYIFERRPIRLLFVNGGFHIVSFAVMGMILGAWH